MAPETAAAVLRSQYQPGILCYILALIFLVIGSSSISSVAVTQLAQQQIHASGRWHHRKNPYSRHPPENTHGNSVQQSIALERSEMQTIAVGPAVQQQSTQLLADQQAAAGATEQQQPAQERLQEKEVWQLLQEAKAEATSTGQRIRTQVEQLRSMHEFIEGCITGRPASWQQKITINIRDHGP